MIKFILTFLMATFVFSLEAFASCSYPYSCGSEYITERDNRRDKPVKQPAPSPRIMGQCGEMLPARYEIRLGSYECNSAQESRMRLPEEIKKDVYDLWETTSRTGAGAQEKMQAIRKTNLGWDGKFQFNLGETWTYKEKVGGYDSRCGMEAWETTCRKDRTEEYKDYEDERYCAKYEDPKPAPSYDGGGGNRYDGGGGGYKGGGENRQDLNRSYDKYGKILEKFNPIGKAHARSCERWATRQVEVKRRRTATPLTYSCRKQRPQWCEWFVTRSESRGCQRVTMNYKVNYVTPSYWRPGYKSPEGEHRNYFDVLPNAADLLPGESEKVSIGIGSGSVMQPDVQISSKWYEYQVKAVPSQIRCEFNMNTSVEFQVIPKGRNVTIAPNPLVAEQNTHGEIDAVEFEQGMDKDYSGNIYGKGLPSKIKLIDTSRELAKNSSEFSRRFDENAYFAESRYKVQLFREDKYGRLVTMTIPNTFNSNQGDIFGNSLHISLQGNDGLDTFYRTKGPAGFLLEGFWKQFGLELTPGEEYFIHMQMLHQGLPFYQSGCRGGKSVCENETSTDSAYSEPIVIKWIADPETDNRSWFKKWQDIQEFFMFL